MVSVRSWAKTWGLPKSTAHRELQFLRNLRAVGLDNPVLQDVLDDESRSKYGLMLKILELLEPHPQRPGEEPPPALLYARDVKGWSYRRIADFATSRGLPMSHQTAMREIRRLRELGYNVNWDVVQSSQVGQSDHWTEEDEALSGGLGGPVVPDGTSGPGEESV